MNFKSLNELRDILVDNNYTILGHGTGGNNTDAIRSIFQEGLRASHSSIFYTTIGLDVDESLERFKNKLDNWQHLDSENIILIRLPNEYFNMYGDAMDLGCERTGAFVNQLQTNDGKKIYYLNPKFIIGVYNRNSGKVLLNDKFEKELTEESISELKRKLKETLIRTKKKNRVFDSLVSDLKPIDSDLDDDVLSSSSVVFDESALFTDFENIEWEDNFSLNSDTLYKR